MIVFKRYGKTLRVSNESWKELRRRLSPDYARRYKNTYVIRIDCPLCKIFDPYKQNCISKNGKKCTFKQFSVNSAGCKVFLRKLFRNGPLFEDSNRDKIFWQAEKDKQVRVQLKRIQKLMDEVEKEQPPKGMIQLRT